MSRELSEEVHAQLVANGVVAIGECADPKDLPALVDLVWQREHSQREFVQAMRPSRFRNATPNAGYICAVALMLEGIIRTIVTLNFDLALTHSLAFLNAGTRVATLRGPEDWAEAQARTIVYLHRNIESDPETMVLRTSQLNEGWKRGWEQIAATMATAAPVCIFVGLGSPTPVLAMSTTLVHDALTTAETFLVGPSDRSESAFADSLDVDDSHYVQSGWNEFMHALAERTLLEHQRQLTAAASKAALENGADPVDIGPVIERLSRNGIAALGMARGIWLRQRLSYEALSSATENELVADLLTGVALVEQATDTNAVLRQQGVLEFRDGARIIGRAVLASGRGSRTAEAVATKVHKHFRGELTGELTPTVFIVGGATAAVGIPAPPADISGETAADDIVGGIAAPLVITLQEMRAQIAPIVDRWSAA